jgi:hypothetical protein
LPFFCHIKTNIWGQIWHFMTIMYKAAGKSGYGGAEQKRGFKKMPSPRQFAFR